MATIVRSGILLLQVLTLHGCLGLAVYEDDSTGMVAGKVVTRTLLALSTGGLSEELMYFTKTEHEDLPWPLSSGSHILSPDALKKGVVFVVWGNHPTAVSRVTDWIQQGGHRVVERDH